jgi:hypothetical protein
MRRGFWAGVVPGALVALLLVQQQGYAAKASAKPNQRTIVVTGKHVPENKHVPEKSR